MGDVNEDDGWDHVATWLQEEIERQGVTLRRIEIEGGVAYRTVQKLLAGEPVHRRDALTRLASFLGYRADAVDMIRRGQTPVREVGDHAVIDLNSAAAELSPEDRQAVLDFIAEQRRKQQS